MGRKPTEMLWVLTLPSGIIQSSHGRKRGRTGGICELRDGEDGFPVDLYEGDYVEFGREKIEQKGSMIWILY